MVYLRLMSGAASPVDIDLAFDTFVVRGELGQSLVEPFEPRVNGVQSFFKLVDFAPGLGFAVGVGPELAAFPVDGAAQVM